MRRLVAWVFYSLCKALGLFALARRRASGRLRILCYHGFALEDEARFRTSLFISPDVLARRMDYLARHGFRVVAFDQAVQELQEGTLAPDTVAITIDDGFYSTHAAAMPVLARHGFPATLYLTSYYLEKGTPIFQLAVDYICWKSPLDRADLSGLGVPELDRMGTVRLDTAAREQARKAAFAHGSSKLDHDGRESLAELLGERLAVDYARLRESRLLSLVSPQELVELERSGVRIELHTHRHHLPVATESAIAEIEDNRKAVEPIIGRRMTHFCYPSGLCLDEHALALRKSGIATATTCEAGLARPGDDPLTLPRVLDDSRVRMIEFEAEMTGFSEILRDLRRQFWSRATPLTVTGDWVINAAMPLAAI